jgi:hypothetical protein
MNEQILRIKKTRESLINVLADISVEAYNKIPSGFNNNIIWNVGHLIAAQQGVCYVRAGVKPVTEKYFLQYKPETKPEHPVDENEVEEIKETLLSSIDQLEIDYTSHLFTNYPSWTTRYGVEIGSIDDALGFLMYHEGLHTGTIMALKRLVAFY